MNRGSVARVGAVAVTVAAAGLAASACHHDRGGCAQGARIALVTPAGFVGFDTDFSVEARPLCPEVRAGTIAWRQVAGPRAANLVATDRGFALRGRTPPLAQALGGPPPWGVVPLSPRTLGEVVLQATWTDDRGHEERHEARVFAAPRSRGLPNLPMGARAYLGGDGWRLEARPQGSAAALDVAGGVTSLLPDAAGDWRLADGAGRSLTLRTARYDETPLDCGRSGCHAALVTASAGTKMTTVLARGLSPSPNGHGALFGAGYPDCALACHATGEPGVADGGFVNVMNELGIPALGARRWEAVPRALRRLGGVGCLACHGPGALPEASARWSILRADVCATCHDAPPRYGHVAAWRSTGMARADRDTRAATQPGCVRCHTTWGFLAWMGDFESATPTVDRRPPAGIGPIGLSCATCHAVHEAKGSHGPEATSALLQSTPRPASLADAVIPTDADKSRVCLVCHAPPRGETTPVASAAALWLGRGGVEPTTGVALTGEAPHARVKGGCIGCHRAGPSGLERGAGHGFSVDRTGCASCHPSGLPPDELRARAGSLWAAWLARAGAAAAPAGGAGPPHAHAARIDRDTPLGRAAWDISLVLEDPAAAAHNAPYARMLLAAAERTLNGAGKPPGRP